MTLATSTISSALSAMLTELEEIGRRPSGGFDRFAWTDEDRRLRAWFASKASARGLSLECDRNGNLFAWWLPDGTDVATAQHAIVTGSHLDSVPGGGGYDGPLGVISGLLAIDVLAGGAGVLRHPIAVAMMADEEGARFSVACVGSRLMTGALSGDAARALTDRAGMRLDEVLALQRFVTAAEAPIGSSAIGPLVPDPDHLGADHERLARIAAFVELHIEQGRGLADLDAPLGLATEIWPHGRYRCRVVGEANHAGTTRLEDRHDPVLVAAEVIVATRRIAERCGAHATFGRLEVVPNAVNAVASEVDAYLDARAPSTSVLTELVAAVTGELEAAAVRHQVEATVVAESVTEAVRFDEALRAELRSVLGHVPELGTAAGHDAGILAAAVPTAMLFVRNPTGVSHSPAEAVSIGDAVAGVVALAEVLSHLACR
jgi:N-carbamoyl-L-amino-acid hydrolase